MAEDSLTVKSATSHQTRSFSAVSSTKTRSDSFIFPNGDQYQGEFTITDDGQMMRHGFGKHINGDQRLTYEGVWDNDKMHGHGRLTFADGSSYDGDFQLNFFEGIGTFTWPDGAQFIGTWQRSKPVGKSEYIGPILGVPFVGESDGNQVQMRYKISSN